MPNRRNSTAAIACGTPKPSAARRVAFRKAASAGDVRTRLPTAIRAAWTLYALDVDRPASGLDAADDDLRLELS
jgi:hypothetical protein